MLPGIVLATRDSPNLPPASRIAPIRYRVDERLIVPSMHTGGDCSRLAMRLGSKAADRTSGTQI
jgi:hypothetical protein